nr:MAG TPA: hypothetical protein [Caudoviricetes sp.]
MGDYGLGSCSGAGKFSKFFPVWACFPLINRFIL